MIMKSPILSWSWVQTQVFWPSVLIQRLDINHEFKPSSVSLCYTVMYYVQEYGIFLVRAKDKTEATEINEFGGDSYLPKENCY